MYPDQDNLRRCKGGNIYLIKSSILSEKFVIKKNHNVNVTSMYKSRTLSIAWKCFKIDQLYKKQKLNNRKTI